MNKEYKGIESENFYVTEFHQPREHTDNSMGEYLERRNEYWMGKNEYADEVKADSATEEEKAAHKEKEKNQKRHKKLIQKMVYAVASAATIVTLSQTINDTSYQAGQNISALEEVTIIFSGDGILTSDMVQVELEKYGSITAFRAVIEEGITQIGDGAFSSNHKLRSVEIPEGVTEIGDRAFSSCYKLKSVEIPESVKTIGEDAFSYCYDLEIKKLTTAGRDIKNYAFNKVTIKEVVLSESIHTDGNAFSWTNVENISYEEGITKIPEGVFHNCEIENAIKIPEGVTEIGNRAFSSCENLKSVEIPESVKTIGEEAFSLCYDLEIEKLTTAGRDIKNYAFREVTIKEVVLSESIHTDGDAFSWTNVENISFEDGITTIPEDVFSNCKIENTVKIPQGVTKIGDRAFSSCHKLKSVEIPESVKTIGEKAFSLCYDLEIEKLTTAGRDIKNEAFSKVTIKEVVLSESIHTDGDAFSWTNVENISFEDGITTIPEDVFSNCNIENTVKIPQGVTKIGDRAFSSCHKLGSVEIPESVKTIGEDAFRYCNNLVLKVAGGSYAEAYAKENDLTYITY